MYCLLSLFHSTIQALLHPPSAFVSIRSVLYNMQHDLGLDGALFVLSQAGVTAPFIILMTHKHLQDLLPHNRETSHFFCKCSPCSCPFCPYGSRAQYSSPSFNLCFSSSMLLPNICRVRNPGKRWVQSLHFCFQLLSTSSLVIQQTRRPCWLWGQISAT